MKAELSLVRFIHPVTSVGLDVDPKKQRHLRAYVDDNGVTVSNSTPGHLFPTIHIPLSNVAFYVQTNEGQPKKGEKGEAKK